MAAAMFFYCHNAIAQTEEEVSNLLTLSKNLTPARKVENYVNQKLKAWQQKGEFEKTSDYLERINAYNTETATNGFTKAALAKYRKEFLQTVNWKSAWLSIYDADEETFKVNVENIGSFVVKVPQAQAPAFKTNFHQARFSNIRLFLGKAGWELTYVDIGLPSLNSTYTYDAQNPAAYDPQQINITVQPVDLSQWIDETVKKETPFGSTVELDDYDITTNLPETNMSNPDAMAVVIGNANYQHTKNVRFAVNDASVIRTYLINVLRFKPGNIIFETNATTGTFNALFGTKGNPRGTLHDRIKVGVSDVFIFYSGHGVPDIDGHPYLLPVDANPTQVSLTGYPLNLLYENLAALNVKSITSITDACFSGKTIEDVSAAGIVPKNPELRINNGVLMTSSTGKEFATWYDAKQQGLFTWFFLKAIHDYKNSDTNGDNQLTFKEIYNYISDKTAGIPYYSGYLYSDEYRHHPTIMGNGQDRVLVEYE